MDEYNHEYGRIPINELGMTTNITTDQLDQLKAKIRFGASRVELGFMGHGMPKAPFEANVPEHYGKDVRKEIRELAELNEVKLTTHVAPDIGNISGFSGQQHSFNEKARKDAQDEINRAIDFAADTAGGGAVVFHLGEWHRPVFEAEETDEGKEGKRTFLAYGENPDDPERLYEHTDEGPLYQTEESESFSYLIDKTTGKPIQESVVTKGQKIPLPDFDPVTGEVIYKDENGEYTVKERNWEDVKRMMEEYKRNNLDNEDIQNLTPEKWLFQARIKEGIGEMESQIEYYSDPQIGRERTEGMIAKYKSQIKKLEQMKDNAVTMETFGLTKTADSLANVGMHAMKKSKNEENPLYVAPENVFPEAYGGHPDEMIKIVEAGREAMVKKLTKKEGMDREEAEGLAAKHIKTTFDMAHLNTWRRLYQGSDEEFKKWMLKKVKKLRKKGVLGHIHISDNFGYSDEHVDPGQGNVPIHEVMEELKKSGEKLDFIVETGKQGDRAFTKAFGHIGTGFYGLSRPATSDPWDIVESSYFGRTAPPYFVVGKYAEQVGGSKNKESFSSWTGVPFE